MIQCNPYLHLEFISLFWKRPGPSWQLSDELDRHVIGTNTVWKWKQSTWLFWKYNSGLQIASITIKHVKYTLSNYPYATTTTPITTATTTNNNHNTNSVQIVTNIPAAPAKDHLLNVYNPHAWWYLMQCHISFSRLENMQITRPSCQSCMREGHQMNIISM